MGTEAAKRRCARELAKLAPLLEAEDRKLAMVEFDISYITVSRYLTGKVSNLILGINLLNFFKRKILERSQELNKLTSSKQRRQ
jgi:hypothetical protein